MTERFALYQTIVVCTILVETGSLSITLCHNADFMSKLSEN
jgi:hypothetical protein